MTCIKKKKKKVNLTKALNPSSNDKKKPDTYNILPCYHFSAARLKEDQIMRELILRRLD